MNCKSRRLKVLDIFCALQKVGLGLKVLLNRVIANTNSALDKTKPGAETPEHRGNER